MTIKELQAHPGPSPLPLLRFTLSKTGYQLILVAGEDNLNTSVDHQSKIITFEGWCNESNLGALAVVAHECAHILQVGSFLFNLSLNFPCKLTHILLELDANSKSCIILKSLLNKQEISLVKQFYTSQIRKYLGF